MKLTKGQRKMLRGLIDVSSHLRGMVMHTSAERTRTGERINELRRAASSARAAAPVDPTHQGVIARHAVTEGEVRIYNNALARWQADIIAMEEEIAELVEARAALDQRLAAQEEDAAVAGRTAEKVLRFSGLQSDLYSPHVMIEGMQ